MPTQSASTPRICCDKPCEPLCVDPTGEKVGIARRCEHRAEAPDVAVYERCHASGKLMHERLVVLDLVRRDVDLPE